MIAELNIYATISRILERDGASFTVTDLPEPPIKFMSRIILPSEEFPTVDGSPRDFPPYTLQWRQGLLGVGDLQIQAGFRVTLTRPTNPRQYDNRVYEFLNMPRLTRIGGVNTGLQAQIAPVGMLYPYHGVLREQDDTEVREIDVAMWSLTESHLDTGQYEDFTGEAPVDADGEIRSNRSIWIGTDRYMILSARLDTVGPRVLFEARRSNA